MNSSEKHRRNVSNCMNLKLKGWRLLVGKHNTSNPHRQKFYNSNSKKVKSPVLVLGGTTIPFFWRVCRIAQDKKTSGAWPCMSQISRCQANLQDMDESTAAARNAVLGAASNTQTQKNQLRWMKEIYHLKTMGLLRLLTQCHHQETGTSGIMRVSWVGVWHWGVTQLPLNWHDENQHTYHTFSHRIHGTGIFTYMNGWLLW